MGTVQRSILNREMSRRWRQYWQRRGLGEDGTAYVGDNTIVQVSGDEARAFRCGELVHVFTLAKDTPVTIDERLGLDDRTPQGVPATPGNGTPARRVDFSRPPVPARRKYNPAY